MKTLKWIFLMLLWVTTNVQAQVQLVEGVDYDVLKPVQPVNVAPGKIEVIEFFSYMCPHCAHLEPELAQWQQTLPADIVFRQQPVVFQPRWEPTAKLYFALASLGEIKRLHMLVFKAIHEQRANLMSDEAVIAWAAKNGINQNKFTEAYRSFTNASNVRRSIADIEAYGISGVPNLVIAGKYRVPGAKFEGQKSVIAIVNAMIDRARKELPKANRAEADKRSK